MLTTYLAVFGIPVAFAFVGWLILRDVDRLLDQRRDFDIFAGTRRQIRALPETTARAPYDWQLEDAA